MITTITNLEPPKTYQGVTSQEYPRIAFCSAITPATPEHYQNLRKAGIDTVSVCLCVSGFNYYKFATIHTRLAREAGMITHVYMTTDLYNITEDVALFTKRYMQLGYNSSTKITLLINGDKFLDDRNTRVLKLLSMMSKYFNGHNIDLAFYKGDIDNQVYDLSQMPLMINLTIFSGEQPYLGIDGVGTWVYTTHCMDADLVQPIAYDYYGFYTDQANYQLSLIDTDYRVQPGDTWYSISRRQGIPINDLLMLNQAEITDLWWPSCEDCVIIVAEGGREHRSLTRANRKTALAG